ncbi:MAG TPA: endolytic transglycosylase MltG [Solirubrobacteraceae bacterium]|nr:endolytic transglycosylase MltG [Solirubrobacteraceae bacterium]
MSRGNRPGPAHERTAQEREDDRLERERRRAEREGAAARPDSARAAEPTATASSGAEQAPAPALEHAPEPIQQQRAEPAQEQAPEPAQQQAPEPAQEPNAVEDPHATQAFEAFPAPLEAEPAAAEAPAWAVGEDAHDAPSDEHAAPPPANLVVGQRMREPSGRVAGGGGGGRAPRRRSVRARPANSHGGRRFTRARAAALLALLAAVALVWFLLSLFQPFAGSGSGKVIVSIPKGSSSSKIGSILAQDGVVSSGFFFDVRALLAGKRSSLHSGRFQLKRDMSYSAAIDALSKPPPRVIAVKVVIPEGYTRRQIADLVAEDALTGSYLAATKRSSGLDPAHYGAPAGTRDLEGFLFPATYELTAGAPVKRLVDEQLTAFRQRFTTADRRRARALGVTPYELLTVASMIEREAQTNHDRPLIAAVIYNRLHEGIPLGIDATTYYAVELQKGIATYTGELTESQLKINSPYNTRTHKGLPPTPISNPGEASIDAAAHPAHAHYLYYVAGADGCGEQAFSSTYAQFQQNVAAYQAAVKKNGGRPPTCKKK